MAGMLYWPIRSRSATVFCLKARGFLGEEACTSLWLHRHGGVFLLFPGTIKKRSRRGQTNLKGHWKKVWDILLSSLHQFMIEMSVIYSCVCITPSFFLFSSHSHFPVKTVVCNGRDILGDRSYDGSQILLFSSLQASKIMIFFKSSFILLWFHLVIH